MVHLNITRPPFRRKVLAALIFAGTALLTVPLTAQAQAPQPRPAPTGAGIVEEIYVWGRGIELLGAADSGSHGIVSNADFSTRPLMRVGELVEVVPGMVATQHSGPGKANQYFLRGMNLDHGSDFSAMLDGMPINFRSHAHASGYLDINILIPEIVESVEFHKGPYYAFNGDFTAAGSARFNTYDRIAQPYLQVEGGSFGNRRLVGAGSHDFADGSLLLATEIMHHDGPWDLPADQDKVNVYGKYTGNIGDALARISFQGYDSSWNSTDQIPLREVEAGRLSRFGFIDPSLGGKSSRYSLIGTVNDGNFEYNAYASAYKLNLFSNPTFFLNDPINGDQIEQQDDRQVYGGYAHYSRDLQWGRRTVTPTLGLDLRYDDIGSVGLFNTVARQRIGTVRDDQVEEMSYSLWGQTEVLWSDSFRTTVGLRGEFYNWDVNSHQAQNSGSGNDSMWFPKLAAAWIPLEGIELYANYGHGFHSNDVRGAEIKVDPVTLDPVAPVDALVRAKGSELGLRYEPFDGLNMTLVHFWMDLDSELLFVGDAGTSEPNEATKRRGVELAAFWEITDNLVLDFNATRNHARFRNAPAGLDHVPDAHETTLSAGLTYVGNNGFTGSFRVRHFGDAPLDEADSVRKDGTTLYNLGTSWKNDHLEVGLDVLNLFNSKGDDIEFFFESQLRNETAPVADFHFHPVESRAYRAKVKYLF